MRCCDCGDLWSSKVQYCLGDWCGGPVEPVDERGEVAGPAVEEVRRPAAELAALVGRQQETDGDAGRAAGEEADDGGAEGSAALAHGGRGPRGGDGAPR